MGADVPKQFLRLGGKTILQLSIERMIEAVPDVHIVLALPASWRAYWLEECDKMRFDIRQRIADGGITRFHSVKNALEKVPSGVLVAVHDAVRPFASAELICRCFDTAAQSGAAVPVVPVTDTLKVLSRSSDGVLGAVKGASAERSVMFCAQTPQVFSSDILHEAYCQAFSPSFTDDASVVEAMGGTVRYIPGEKYNIKLTTPEDMEIARRLWQ